MYTNEQEEKLFDKQNTTGIQGSNIIKDPEYWKTGDEPMMAPNIPIYKRCRLKQARNSMKLYLKHKLRNASTNCSIRQVAGWSRGKKND